MKQLGLVLVILTISFLLATGCQESEQAPTQDKLPSLNNDLRSGKLTLHHQISHDGVDFVTTYSTNYDASKWRITSSKALLMEADVTASGVDVLIEHVHADISILSKLASVDGLSQDSMDDSIHGGSQPGFATPYSEVFAIEGYSETLISGWGFVAGGYGASSLAEDRLTECNLRDDGEAYGQKLQVVYDLAIRYTGEEFFHTHSIIDEFAVPLAKDIGC